MKYDYDVIICGAGPAGLTLSCYLQKKNMKVAVFEKSPFPRHQIGESLLPFSWSVFEDIGFAEKLKASNYVEKYGAYFFVERAKQGQLFLFRNSLNPKYEKICHVDRSTFDHQLLEHAKSLGVEIFQPVRITEAKDTGEGYLINEKYSCKLFVQASGIFNALNYPDNYVVNDAMDDRTAVYSYYKYENRGEGERDGDILIPIFYEPEDSVNLNWAWGIPLPNNIMSVGFVTQSSKYRNLIERFKTNEKVMEYYFELNPTLRKALKNTNALETIRTKSNFQRVAKKQVFDRMMFIGDSAGFIDPVFSSGVHIGLNSARMASEIILAANGNYSKENLMPFEKEYQRLFWTYYRFVKLFYQKNLVENLFFAPPELAKDYVRHITSILSGDVKTENMILKSLTNARLDINPKVREIFANQEA